MDTPTGLLLIDLGLGKQRLGAKRSSRNANYRKLTRSPVVLAYHDRSDGGLFVTVAEMCFAGPCGVTLDLAIFPEVATSSEAFSTRSSVSFCKLEARDVQIPLTVEQFTQLTPRPKVAVVREQGVNSYTEAAWAFYMSGFSPVDVHMTDLITGRAALADDRDMVGTVFPSGFSYGDVLGAGAGWVKSALLNARAPRPGRLLRPPRFALVICNDCQMLAELRDLVPDAARWPRFARNASEQFEAGVCTVGLLRRHGGRAHSGCRRPRRGPRRTARPLPGEPERVAPRYRRRRAASWRSCLIPSVLSTEPRTPSRSVPRVSGGQDPAVSFEQK
ncbi:hypothetical protein HK405_003884 [Cladochytrium tenue]|nr:hypothetical protein HK405_003884 [Cladochytrium tenue]